MSETPQCVDYCASPDLDPSRDLTVDDLILFQRFRQSADVDRVQALLEAEIDRHLKLCETAILWAANVTYYWCELPRHPWQDINTIVARHLEEKGFKIEFAQVARTVTAQPEMDTGRRKEATDFRANLTAYWGHAQALDEKRVTEEWHRREAIEEGARAKYVPRMQSRVDGANIVEQGETAWAAVLDNRYVVEVQRIFHQNTLCVFSLDGRCVHREPTNVSFGAQFGPDVSDVAEWQERAQQIVDGLRP